MLGHYQLMTIDNVAEGGPVNLVDFVYLFDCAEVKATVSATGRVGRAQLPRLSVSPLECELRTSPCGNEYGRSRRRDRRRPLHRGAAGAAALLPAR